MKSQVICLIMLVSSQAFSQQDIEVKCSVHFDTYRQSGDGPYDEVIFRLTIVNNTDHKIPDLGVTSRSEYVHFFVNGEQFDPLSLYNGVEQIKDEYVLLPGDTATFDNAWILMDAGIQQKYGNTFYVEWEYMGIRSKKVHVDLGQKTSQPE